LVVGTYHFISFHDVKVTCRPHAESNEIIVADLQGKKGFSAT